MGREINNAWFSTDTRIERYAPWYAAEVVCFYPSVFDMRGVPAGEGGKSTNMMQHFVVRLHPWFWGERVLTGRCGAGVRARREHALRPARLTSV